MRKQQKQKNIVLDAKNSNSSEGKKSSTTSVQKILDDLYGASEKDLGSECKSTSLEFRKFNTEKNHSVSENLEKESKQDVSFASDELIFELTWREPDLNQDKSSISENQEDALYGYLKVIDENSPQVVKQNGHLNLVKNKKIYPPLFFFSFVSDESKLDVVFNEVKLASENDVKLFMFLIYLEVDESKTKKHINMAELLAKKTIEINKDAQIIFRTVFIPSNNWKKTYPKGIYTPVNDDDPKPSICDDMFWGKAASVLKEFTLGILNSEYSSAMMGIHLEYGEWFYSETQGYDTSKVAVDSYRNWLRVRYRDDVVSLRAAWYDGNVSFDTVQVPEFQKDINPNEEFARMDRRARSWVDYHLFLSDAIVDRIRALGCVVKQVSSGKLLTGVNYGYTFDWSHPASGHLSLGKLLRSPEIDFIAGPPAYDNRESGKSAPFPVPIDSFRLNGKLYLFECDYKTPVKKDIAEPDSFNPVIKKSLTLDGIHYRDFGASSIHGNGLVWMDSWGNGWLNTPSPWKKAKNINDTYARKYSLSMSTPDVVVFIDERSLAYLVDQRSFSRLVHDTRESAIRSGMNVGFYLLSDLAHRDHFPEAKLYIFLNAWDLRPEVRAAIKKKLQNNGKVLFWLYSAGLFESGRYALDRVREVMGIAIKEQPFGSVSGSEIVNHHHEMASCLDDQLLAEGGVLAPGFYAVETDGIDVIAEYKQSALPSIVSASFNNSDKDSAWTSVFCGEPMVNTSLLRVLGKMAGVHVWSQETDVVHVGDPLISIHCKNSGSRTIVFPGKKDVYDFIAKKWIALNVSSYKFDAKQGKSYLFYVGSKGKLEPILKKNIDECLTMDKLPEKADFDILSIQDFDIPIMRLDEWMIESTEFDSDEEYILSTTAIEDEDLVWDDFELPSEQENSGIDKKKTRVTASKKAKKKSATSSSKDQDVLGMNVMFRKRI